MPGDHESRDPGDEPRRFVVIDGLGGSTPRAHGLDGRDDGADESEFDDADADGDGDDSDHDEGAFDDTGDAAPARRPAVRRFQASATGSALAAMMSGLGAVLEPSKKEPTAIVVDFEAPGEPFTEPIVMRLDPDDPRDSIVLVRRHLMAHHDHGDQAEAQGAPPADSPHDTPAG